MLAAQRTEHKKVKKESPTVPLFPITDHRLGRRKQYNSGERRPERGQGQSQAHCSLAEEGGCEGKEHFFMETGSTDNTNLT